MKWGTAADGEAALAGRRLPARGRERAAAVRAARRRRCGAKPPLRRSGCGWVGSSPFSTIGKHAPRSGGSKCP